MGELQLLPIGYCFWRTVTSLHDACIRQGGKDENNFNYRIQKVEIMRLQFVFPPSNTK